MRSVGGMRRLARAPPRVIFESSKIDNKFRRRPPIAVAVVPHFKNRGEIMSLDNISDSVGRGSTSWFRRATRCRSATSKYW